MFVPKSDLMFPIEFPFEKELKLLALYLFDFMIPVEILQYVLREINVF